jgi:hypothetical protein
MILKVLAQYDITLNQVLVELVNVLVVDRALELLAFVHIVGECLEKERLVLYLGNFILDYGEK